ncbi:MAG: hypothetical protein AAB544_01830 [Patescibacteria group bacterium]
MDATIKSKINKTSVVLLATAVIYGLFTIILLYSSFLIFPPILETTDDIKHAVGFFYVPLVTTVLALGALVLKLRAGSKKFAQLCAQLGLLLSGSLIAWWLVFESGFLPTIMLPIIFLAVVVNDLKENRPAVRSD